jgi:DNA-binding IclR family transcriptional regulator
VAKNAKALVLLDTLYRQPTVSVNKVAQTLGCTFPTAAKLVRDFEARGWLRELTGYERNRLWRYQPYLDLFHRDALDAMVGQNDVPPLVTGSEPV